MLGFVVQYITVGNAVIALLSGLVLHFLYELYQFGDMPPGPRLTNLPIIGNLLSFDLKADDFPSAISRYSEYFIRLSWT